MSKQQFLNKLRRHNATVFAIASGDGTIITVEAPEGKAWASEDSETTILSIHHVKGFPIGQAYQSLIDRMKDGLIDSTTE